VQLWVCVGVAGWGSSVIHALLGCSFIMLVMKQFQTLRSIEMETDSILRQRDGATVGGGFVTHS
jgi:hypothetical protein